MSDYVATESAETPILPSMWAGVQDILHDKAYLIMLLFMGSLVVVGAAAGIHAKMIGTMHAYGASRELPWGILISTYVFFVVTATGFCLVSSIGHVFGVKEMGPIAQRSVYLAVATILSGFFVILFEIENPFRMAIYNVISPNLTSNIWWMGTLYGAYMMFMLVELFFLVTRRYTAAAVLGFLGVVAGVAANSNLGAVFGMLGGREFWYGPFMPIYFITSAMMSGAAAIILFTWLANKIQGGEMEADMRRALEITTKIAILLTTVILFFTAWNSIIGFAGSETKVVALKALVAGPYAFNFWVLEIAIGMVIPLVLYIRSRGSNLPMMALGAAMMLFGIFFMRYDLVIVGQIVPAYEYLNVTEYSGLLSYQPTIHEILVVLGGVGVTGFLFMLGEKVFGGHKSEAH